MDFIFNAVLGNTRKYTELSAANDALVVVPLQLAGLEADETLRDYTDLQALLAGSTNEHPMGRKTFATAPAVTVSNSLNKVTVGFFNSDWANPTGPDIGAIVICYDPDTTTGTDSTLVPISKHDFQVVGLTGSGNITARVATEGLIQFLGS